MTTDTAPSAPGAGFVAIDTGDVPAMGGEWT